MVKRLELRAAAAGIRLEAYAGGWARCYLTHEGGEVFLGAESLPNIVERLSSGLCGAGGEVAGHMSGRAVWWVLSLAEQHCTLYVTADGGEPTLFWQDRNGSLLAALALPEATRGEWCEQLSRAARGET